mmetsp:Transcript_63657/g.134131  ORF Transcript_63657/g.134131 Transcript_63657/m.134131 type:complete len:208 (+) Transcript_63657:1660-2283(+)
MVFAMDAAPVDAIKLGMCKESPPVLMGNHVSAGMSHGSRDAGAGAVTQLTAMPVCKQRAKVSSKNILCSRGTANAPASRRLFGVAEARLGVAVKGEAAVGLEAGDAALGDPAGVVPSRMEREPMPTVGIDPWNIKRSPPPTCERASIAARNAAFPATSVSLSMSNASCSSTASGEFSSCNWSNSAAKVLPSVGSFKSRNTTSGLNGR